jgi:hypothetical protein
MKTWRELFGKKGFYQTENILLNLNGDGAITKINWDSIEPEGTYVRILSSFSTNGGNEWSEWRELQNNSEIPELNVNIPLSGVLLRFRVFLQANGENIPILNEMNIELEPVLIFDNKGDSYCTPEIWIQKIGNGDVSLINTSNKNEEFKFTGLINNETVYVNNERKYIESDLPMVYRFSNFNGKYMKLPVGLNVFRVEGNAKIKFRYQLKLI